MKKFFLVVLVTILCVSMSACQKVTIQEFIAELINDVDSGNIEDNRYNNPELGFDFDLPDLEKYSSIAPRYRDTYETNPASFSRASGVELFYSYYSNDSSFMRIRITQTKYPDSKMYDSHAEYSKEDKDNYVRYLSSTFKSEWKEKASITEPESSVAGDNEYSWFKVYNSEEDRYITLCYFNHGTYIFSIYFYNWGEEPDSVEIERILASINFYNE